MENKNCLDKHLTFISMQQVHKVGNALKGANRLLKHNRTEQRLHSTRPRGM